MSVEYQFQKEGRVSGPVTFRDLVRKVRTGNLNVDDLVKSDWEDHWMPAAAVVGLFHMAGRDDVLARWEAEQQSTVDSLQLSAASHSTNSPQESLAQPDWGAKAMELQEQELDEQIEEFKRRQEDRRSEVSYATLHNSQKLANHISAATTAVDLRKKRGTSSKTVMFFTFLQSFSHDETLHRWFRWGITFIVANVVGIEIVRRSLAQMRQFPQSGLQPSIPTSFPFWGECSPTLFFILLVDVMLLAGVLGYWGARSVEQLVDE